MSHARLVLPSRAAVAVWPEMGQMLGVGKGAAYHLVNSGRVRSVRVGRRIIVPLNAIEEFLHSESRGAPS